MSSTDTRTGFRLPWSSDRSPHDERPSAPESETDPSDADAALPADTGLPGDGWPDADLRGRSAAATIAPPEPEVVPDVALTPAPARPEHRRPTKFLADLTAAMRAAADASREQTIAQFQADAKQVVDGISETSTAEATDLRTRADDDVSAIREWSKAEIARIREETDARIAQRRESLDGELEAHAGDVERRVAQVQAAIAGFEQEMAVFFDRLFAETDPAAFAALAERMPEPPVIDGLRDGTAASGWTEYPSAEAETAAWTNAEPELADRDLEGGHEDSEADVTGLERTGAAESLPTGFAEGHTGESVEGDMPNGFEADGTPVDQSAIMAALEAAAEAVVAAEAAAESASQAEVAAGLAETAAELLSGRIDEGEGWGDLDSAEAEAALAARIDAGGVDEGSFVDRLAGLTPRGDAGDGEPRSSQIVVNGLVSVASIASFKRHLARVAGVTAVSVSSGPDGEFVFTATHRADVSFRDVVPGLPGFGARVTNAADGVVNVTAHDPESDG